MTATKAKQIVIPALQRAIVRQEMRERAFRLGFAYAEETDRTARKIYALEMLSIALVSGTMTMLIGAKPHDAIHWDWVVGAMGGFYRGVYSLAGVPVQAAMTPRKAKEISIKILSEWKAREPLNFSKWIFPVIANMPDNTNLADLLTDVQPMSMPSSEIYYKDFNSNSWWYHLLRWLRIM